MKQHTGTCCICTRGQDQFKDRPDDRPYICTGERAPMCGPCRRSGHHTANSKQAASSIPVQAVAPERDTLTEAQPVTTHGQPVMHRSIAPADPHAPHLRPVDAPQPQSLNGAPVPAVSLLELAYRDRLGKR